MRGVRGLVRGLMIRFILRIGDGCVVVSYDLHNELMIF